MREPIAGDAEQARETERIRRFYDASAGAYDGWLGTYERWMGLAEARRKLLARASGRTLELAVGTGANLVHYPPGVQLTGIDLSPAMLAAARQRADHLGIAVELRLGDAHRLDLPDDAFDTAVTTLSMSTIPSCRQAATELRRVLKPNGVLLLLDHVRSPIAPVRWMERMIEPLTMKRWGFSLMRDPLDFLEEVGFRVEHCERARLGILESVIARKN